MKFNFGELLQMKICICIPLREWKVGESKWSCTSINSSTEEGWFSDGYEMGVNVQIF